MFTGIVEEIGKVSEIRKESNGVRLGIRSETVISDANIGDSIAINGVCQTVESINGDIFTVFVSRVTLDLTNLSNLKTEDNVNLERALTTSSRMGGHIVQGHIDGTGNVLTVNKSINAIDFRIGCSSKLMMYIVEKGSVCVNGVSLTVVSVFEGGFSIYLIPESIKKTNLYSAVAGNKVNIEVDILAKYIEKMVTNDSTKEDFLDRLERNGFLG
ncbi:MAG TPA: riboflavin synthase [Spirochaetota bacterium]|nr:riboflavin synthase [Spirochaetota bacterium]